MLSILYGDNSFAVAHEKNRIIGEYLAEQGSDIGLEQFDSTVDAQSLWQSVISQPFMVRTKLVVLNEPSQSAELTEFILEKLDHIPDTTHLLIVETNLDKRTSYYKSIKKNPNSREFKSLDEAELINWLVDSSSKSLTKQQARLVIERAGTDQWRLSNELKKLTSVDKITDEVIKNLVDQDPSATIFSMLDALTLGKQKHAYELYENLREQQLEPQYILTMLVWQLQNTFLSVMAGSRNDADIARDAGINPYVVRKTRSTAGRLNKSILKNAVKVLIDCDEGIKTGKIDADEGVRLVILKLASIFN